MMNAVLPFPRSSRHSLRRSSRCLAVLAVACAASFCSAQAQTENRSQIPSGAFRIAGTVVNAKVGNPLGRCRVTITDSKNSRSEQSLITADDGRFEFHVPAGKYTLRGAKRGFISALYSQHEQFSSAIVTGADLDTETLVLRLAPNAVLTGKVLDEFGDPVRNAQIRVYREDRSQGVSRINLFRGASTDDQGHYEVTQLDEGTYFVSAKAQPWYAVHPASNAGNATQPSQVDSSLDVAYPITYYGDATEAEDAAPIPVRGGDRLEADIHLNPVPSLHLLVHVPEDSGTRGIVLPTLQKPSFDGMEETESTNVHSVAPGVFEITGVAAGRYTVRMSDSGGHSRESSEVDLNSGGELDISSGNLTSKVMATVGIESAAELPSSLHIELRNRKGRVNAGSVDAKGEVNFSDVIPGKYEVLADSPTQRLSVVRIASEAGIISGHSLNVPPGATLALSLSLVGGSTTVEGFAKRDGKAVSGAMVVLVPKNAESDRDRFRRDESDLDGSFGLRDVIPGSYTVIAIENGWDLDWAQPGVLAGYLKHGQPIEVGVRSATTMHLADGLEVQTK
jgi:Carboxypeptidase regulatory-like domain